jgi:putative ABC transport system permease protein
MWLKKLRKKQLQCFLVGALLFISSLIFTSSLSMMTSIKGYVEDYYSKGEFYDLAIINLGAEVEKEVLQWCQNNADINKTKTFDTYVSGNDLYFQGRNLKLSVYDIIPLEDAESSPFGITKVISNNNSVFPGEGEVWIAQLMADSYGIQLGDTLTVKTKGNDITLKVTCIINDYLHPSTASSDIMLFVNNNEAVKFSDFMKLPLIFIDAAEQSNIPDIEKSIMSLIKAQGSIMDKAMLIQSAVMTPSMVGGASTLASILIFIVSMLMIRFLVWNNILKEYKSIGIYKALGFSKGEILSFYLKGYSLTALIGSILGALGSILVLNYTASKVLKYIGDFESVNIDFKLILKTIVLFTLAVMINLYLVIKRTNKITPVEVLRTGITSSRKKLRKSIIKNTSSPLAWAINDMFKYKKLTALITLTLTLSLTLVLLFGNFSVTTAKLLENSNLWCGIPKGDVTISAPVSLSMDILKEGLAEVERDSRVESYIYGSLFSTEVFLDIEKYPINSSQCPIMTMSSYSDEFEFAVIKGRRPENYTEVAVTTNILKDTGLSIGDYIELSINNKVDSFLICGSYYSMVSNGYGIRILNAAIQKEFPEFRGSEIFVKLKADVDKEQFKKDINDRYSYLDASNLHPLFAYVMAAIPDTILPMAKLLILVFLAFSTITILSIIITHIRDNRRNFGILKALGFTTREIRSRFLLRILIITLFSTLVAVTLNLALGPPLIAAAINDLDVLIISPITMVSLVAAMILLVLITTIICCSVISKAKPTELIEE